jgi:hypothetical protein
MIVAQFALDLLDAGWAWLQFLQQGFQWLVFASAPRTSVIFRALRGKSGYRADQGVAECVVIWESCRSTPTAMSLKRAMALQMVQLALLNAT